MGVKRKVKEWSRRYLPAEVLSIVATLSAGLLVHYLSHGSMLATALACTIAGNIAYFGYILYCDVNATRQRLQDDDRVYTNKHLLINLRSMVIEFGLAEVIDTLFVRPVLTYYLPALLGNLALGILAAKLIADVCFYIPAIIGYELNKKHLRRKI